MKFNDFYRGRKVLITGHTGFKGTWMTSALISMGAEVMGYALDAPTNPSLFGLSGIEKEIHSEYGDVRDLGHLSKTLSIFRPEIVIHMAAQPLVRESYNNPVYTYETNVMGTVNVLEAVRKSDSVRAFLNVTTDKVYLNRELDRGYREDEELNGFDPYSNSKSCSELVTSCYKSAFFEGQRDIAISTCRAGNVIGGGDFAKDRIIPDCVRAVEKGEKIVLRNPNSTRPYQHVLEPVMAYLMVLKGSYENSSLASNYNVGPDDCDCLTTGNLVKLFCDKWNAVATENASLHEAAWEISCKEGPHEANFLKLDSTKLKESFGWKPTWGIENAVEKTIEWVIAYLEKADVRAILEKQTAEFMMDNDN